MNRRRRDRPFGRNPAVEAAIAAQTKQPKPGGAVAPVVVCTDTARQIAFHPVDFVKLQDAVEEHVAAHPEQDETREGRWARDCVAIMATAQTEAKAAWRRAHDNTKEGEVNGSTGGESPKTKAVEVVEATYHRHHQVKIPAEKVILALREAGWDVPVASGLSVQAADGKGGIDAVAVWWQTEESLGDVLTG